MNRVSQRRDEIKGWLRQRVSVEDAIRHYEELALQLCPLRNVGAISPGN